MSTSSSHGDDDRNPRYTEDEAREILRATIPEVGHPSLRFCGQGSDFCSYAVDERRIIRIGINDESGMRAIVGQSIIDFPVPDASSAAESLAYARDLIGRWKDHPRVIATAAPHARTRSLATTQPRHALSSRTRTLPSSTRHPERGHSRLALTLCFSSPRQAPPEKSRQCAARQAARIVGCLQGGLRL